MSFALATWERRPLESLAEAVDYGHTASASKTPIGPRFLRITDIQNGSVEWDSVPFCAASDSEINRYRLKPGDVVFARTGNTTGKSFLIRDCPEDTVFASYLIRVRPSSRIEPRYLGHFFDTPDYWAQITKTAQGAGQPGVNATKLKQLEIPLPPLPEQKRIADILDKADAVRRRRREAVREARKLFLAAFADFFGNPLQADDTIPLGQCVQIVSGGTPSKKNANYWNGAFPWVSPKDMKANYIGDAEDHVSDLAFQETTLKKIPDRSVLIVVRGMILAHTVPIALTDVPVAINQDMKALVPKDGVNPVFLRWSMQATHNYLLSKVATAAHGTKRLEVEHIAALPVPRAPKSRQGAFATAVDRIRTIVSRYENDLADQLFDSLVQRAFKGEL